MLKFSNNLASNTAGLLETLKVTTDYKEQDLEKIFKIVRLNNDFESELTRKHRFKIEYLMIKRMRNFLNTFASKVTQKNLGAKTVVDPSKNKGEFSERVKSQRIGAFEISKSAIDERPRSSESFLESGGYLEALKKLRKKSPNTFKEFIRRSSKIKQIANAAEKI